MSEFEEETGGVTLATIDSDLAIINANLTNGNNKVIFNSALLGVTATGTSGAAVTLTLPGVALVYHNIILLEIEAYSTAARAGSATPVVVTSTNLPGSPAWTFATAATIGTTDTKLYAPSLPFHSLAFTTPTTIVCPATTGIIWRVNVWYYTGA